MKSKFLAVILTSALALSACSAALPNETAAPRRDENTVTFATESTTAQATNYERYIPPNFTDTMTQEEILQMMGLEEAYIYSTGNDEPYKKLNSAFRNIKINNTIIALPLMVNDLPKGFSVKYTKDTEVDSAVEKFKLHSGSLCFNDKECGKITLVKRSGADDKYGIIIGMTLLSTQCKWSFGNIIHSCDQTAITDTFGDPAYKGNVAGLAGDSLLYLGNNKSAVVFSGATNGVFCFNLNADNAIDNASLVTPVPYDDFDGEKAPPKLKEDKHPIDWSMVFDEDCIAFGNTKYPALTNIGTFNDDDVVLLPVAIGEEDYDGYLLDTYNVLYKGRQVAEISAERPKNVPAEDAIISTWYFSLEDCEDLPVGMMGFPLSQSAMSVSQSYEPTRSPGMSDMSTYYYVGIAENVDQSYTAALIMDKEAYSLMFISLERLPNAYDTMMTLIGS